MRRSTEKTIHGCARLGSGNVTAMKIMAMRPRMVATRAKLTCDVTEGHRLVSSAAEMEKVMIVRASWVARVVRNATPTILKMPAVLGLNYSRNAGAIAIAIAIAGGGWLWWVGGWVVVVSEGRQR